MLDQLSDEYAEANLAAMKAYADMLRVAAERTPNLIGLAKMMQPRPHPVPEPKILGFAAREYRCASCGSQFFSREMSLNRVLLCSDRCAREQTKECASPAVSLPPRSGGLLPHGQR